MTVKLSNDDISRIVDVVARSSVMESTIERRQILRSAFQLDRIIQQVDIEGSPRTFLVGLIRQLSFYGRIEGEDEALAVFLRTILPYLQPENAEIIQSILTKYNLGAPAISNATSEWKGLETVTSLEKIVYREPESWPIHNLNKAVEAAQTVVRVQTSEHYLSSGFMVGQNVMVVPHHVIGTRSALSNVLVFLGFEEGLDGLIKTPHTIVPRTDTAFYTNATLDYTLIQLTDLPPGARTLQLKDVAVERDETIILIHHPGGGPKRISIQNHAIRYVDSEHIQYTSVGAPGSSGAPVFNQKFEVIGMHHAGGFLQEPQGGDKYFRNEAVRISAILKDCGPDFHNLLTP